MVGAFHPCQNVVKRGSGFTAHNVGTIWRSGNGVCHYSCTMLLAGRYGGFEANVEGLNFGPRKEFPKLSTVAVGYLTAEDFASRLDRAIERSNSAREPKLIEARAIETDR